MESLCKFCATRQVGQAALSVAVRYAVPITARAKNRVTPLLAQPGKKSLELRIAQDLFDRVEGIAQFVMRPGLVNEILARLAGGCCFAPAFATRDHMVSPRWYEAPTEGAGFSDGHASRSLLARAL
jgi:hypothetical protein